MSAFLRKLFCFLFSILLLSFPSVSSGGEASCLPSESPEVLRAQGGIPDPMVSGEASVLVTLVSSANTSVWSASNASMNSQYVQANPYGIESGYWNYALIGLGSLFSSLSTYSYYAVVVRTVPSNYSFSTYNGCTIDTSGYLFNDSYFSYVSSIKSSTAYFSQYSSTLRYYFFTRSTALNSSYYIHSDVYVGTSSASGSAYSAGFRFLVYGYNLGVIDSTGPVISRRDGFSVSSAFRIGLSKSLSVSQSDFIGLFKAVDAVDGDCSSTLAVSGSFFSQRVGSYSVSLYSHDTKNNGSYRSVPVTVFSDIPPSFYLSSGSVFVTSSGSALTEPQIDEAVCSTFLSGRAVSSLSVDYGDYDSSSASEGSYPMSYKALLLSDAGNESSAEGSFSVLVKSDASESSASGWDAFVAWLVNVWKAVCDWFTDLWNRICSWFSSL